MGTPNHSWQMTAQGKSSLAHKGMIATSKILAMSAIEILEDNSLIEKAKEELKKVVVSSSIFSIVPSLPIFISYMLLVPALGKYFPWLRLSVIGSATYETMSADMAAKAYGYSGISSANFTSDVFAAITWTVTFGILLSNLSVL